MHTPETKGHCHYYNPRDRAIRSKLLQIYKNFSSGHNLFIVSNDEVRDSPPAYCNDIPMQKDLFENWLKPLDTLLNEELLELRQKKAPNEAPSHLEIQLTGMLNLLQSGRFPNRPANEQEVALFKYLQNLQSKQAPAEAAVIYNFLNIPAIRNALLQKNPELKNKTDQRLFVELLTCQDPTILPDYFYAYRDLALQLRVLTCALTLIPIENAAEELEDDSEDNSDTQEKYYIIEEMDSSISVKLNYEIGLIAGNDDDGDECILGHDSLSFPHVEGNYPVIYDLIRKQGVIEAKDTELLQDAFVKYLRENGITAPVNTCRELFDLFSLSNIDNGQIHPETQIIKTLSYFSTHVEVLNNKVMREFLSLLLLENDYLERAVYNYPPLEMILANFIGAGISNSFAEGDYPQLVYLLNLGRIVEDIIRPRQKIFPPYLEWIQRALTVSKDTSSTSVKAELYKQYLLEFIRNPQSSQNTSVPLTAIKAYFLYNSFTREDDYSDFSISSYSEFEVKGMYKVLESYILSILSTPENANRFCNDLLVTLEYPNENYQWDLTAYPLCFSSDRKYCINFLSGECLIDGRTSVVLDETFFGPSVKKIFNNPPYKASKDISGFYHVNLGEDKIFVLHEDHPVQHFAPDKIVWSNISFPNCFFLKPITSKWMDHSAWMRNIENEKVEILLRDESFAKAYLITAKIINDKPSIEKVYKILPDGEILELIPLDNIQHPFRLSLPPGIFPYSMLWKNAQGNYVLLEIPEMGQSFAIETLKDGSYVAHSNQFLNFQLANSYLIRNIGKMSYSLVLENNKKKQKKVLLPYGEIVFSEKTIGAFSTDYSLRIKYTSLDVPRPPYLYAIDPVKGLSTPERENKLYLALHLTAQKKYFLAYESLMSSIPSLIPYTKDEIKILNKIGTLNSDSKDPTLQSKSICLLAFILYCQALPEGKIGKSDLHTLELLYSSYTNNHFKASIYLIPDQQMEFAHRILNFSEPLMTSPPPITPGLQAESLNRKWFFAGLNGSAEKLHFTQKDFSEWCKKIKPQLPPNRLLSRPATYLVANFLHFYHKAKLQDSEIDADIIFAGNENGTPHFQLLLLRSVSLFPQNFPSEDELKEIFATNDWSNFYHKVLSPLNFSIPPEKVLWPKKAHEHKKQIEENKNEQIEEASSSGSSSSSMDVVPPVETIAESEPMQISSAKRKFDALDDTSSPATNSPKIRKKEQNVPKIKWQPFFNAKELKAFVKSEEKTEDLLTPEQLQDALDSVDVNIIPGESARLKQEITDYWTSPDRTTPWNLIEQDKLPSLASKAAIIKAEKTKEYNVALGQLILDIENLPDNIKENVYSGIDRQALKHRTPTISELTLFISRPDNAISKSFSPTLLLQEKKIRHQIIEVQSKFVRIQQLERAQKHLNILIDLANEGISSKDITYRQTSENAYYELTRIPPYNSFEHPHLLCMEVLDNTGIYDWQHTDIDSILHPRPGQENIVLQKNMGSGKTQVYLKALALMLAQFGNVPFIIVHSSQFDSVAKPMETNVFDQNKFTFKFSRSEQSPAKLSEIRELLDKAAQAKGFFFITDTTLYELRQCYKETLVQYLRQNPPHPETVEKLKLFIEIDRFMTRKCPSLWDEYDLQANCRFENIYTAGDPVVLPSHFSNIVADIFDSIFSDPELMAVFQAKTYTEEQYHGAIKEKMIKIFLSKHSILQDAVKELMTVDELELFLRGDKAAEKSIKGFPLDIVNLLHIAHDEFNTLFQLTVSKQHNVDYMASNDSNKIFPVPGLACKVPNPTSDFGFIFALLNYIIHTLLAEGVTPRLLEQLIKRMQASSRVDIEQDPTLRLEQTKGYQDFQELTRGVKIDVPFFAINSKHINQLIAALPKDSNYLCAFAKKFIFPLVTYYPLKIVSSPFSIKMMFPRTIALTATPWNHATYDVNINVVFDKTVEPHTIGLLVKNSQVFEIDDFKEDEQGPENIIKALAAIGHDSPVFPFDNLIDCGAFIKVEHNIAGAKLLLKYLPPDKKGVVFFHNNVEMVLERNKPEPIPLEKCNLPLNERHIFFDDWHTTGANIEADPKSCGYLTFDKTSKRKLTQSFGRLRQRHLKQKAIIIVKKSQGTYIRNMLKLEPGTPIKPKHILKISQIITEEEINQQLVSAAQSKLENVIENKIFTSIRNSEADPLPLLKLHPAPLTALITKKNKIVPAKIMGPINQEIKQEEHFNKSKAKLVNKFSPLLQNPLFTGITIEELKEDLSSTLDKCTVPQPIPRNHFSTAQQLVQQQTQQQSQAQVRQEVASNTYNSDYKTTYHSHWNWNFKILCSSPDFFQTYEYVEPFPKDKFNVPIFNLRSLLNLYEGLDVYSDAFNSIELSYNFTPRNGLLFEKNQLESKCAVLIRDKTTQATRIILITEADRGFFFSQLRKETLYAAQNNLELPFEVSLFDFGLGRVFQANQTQIVNVEPFERQILIIKFMYGETQYSKRSLEILKEWIIANDPLKMERFFYNHALHGKDELRQKYPGSPLHKLFISLQEENQG